MDTLVHIVSTLWIYLRRESYLRVAAEAEAQLAELAVTASGTRLQRIQRKRQELAADIRRLNAPLTWASLRRRATAAELPQPHVASEVVRETPSRLLAEESLVEVA